jgi:glycerol uptake facilitator protein
MHDYFWVPIVGPLIGAVVGAIVYDFFIRGVLKARGEQPEQDVEPEGRTIKEVPEI